MKIKWLYHVSNDKLLRCAGVIDTGHFHRFCYGHVVRMPETRLPNFLLEWKPNYGKRLRGRPRKDWMARVLEDAAMFKIAHESKLIM